MRTESHRSTGENTYSYNIKKFKKKSIWEEKSEIPLKFFKFWVAPFNFCARGTEIKKKNCGCRSKLRTRETR